MHVPKHQMGVQAVKRLLEKINSNSREILTIEIRTSLVAVSYTHLDVYKRQLYSSSASETITWLYTFLGICHTGMSEFITTRADLISLFRLYSYPPSGYLPPPIQIQVRRPAILGSIR